MRHEAIYKMLDNGYRAASIGVFTPNEMHMAPETFRHFMTWKVQTLDPRMLLARFTDRAAGNDMAFVMATFETACARLDVKLDEGVVKFVNTRPVQDPIRALEYAITIPVWVRTERTEVGKAAVKVGPEGQFHVDAELDGEHIHSQTLDTPISTTVTRFGGFTLGLRAMVAYLLPKDKWPTMKFRVIGTPGAERVIAEGDYFWAPPVQSPPSGHDFAACTSGQVANPKE